MRITDIQNNSVDWSSVPGCEISKGEVDQYKLEQGDILIARTGGTIGKTFLVRHIPVTAVFASYLIRVQKPSELYDQYLKLFLESPAYWKQLQDGTRGTGQPNVNGRTLGRMAVIVPPLAEQHRIIAKVDELMALCDRLEAAQAERENRRDKLTAASLHRLNNGADTDEFREHARFHFRHLPRLTTRPEHIQQLRQTILNLAVRGKLVPQDPKDEPASELLKRIQAEKARLVKEGEIRKQDTLPLVTEDDQPFFAPAGWLWERLANVSRKIHYGFTASANSSIKAVRLLRITDIQDNSVNWDSVPGCEIADELVDQFKLEAGDILIARTGGTIGKSFLVSQIPVTAVFASYLIRVQGSANLYDQYLKLFIESPVYWRQLEDGSRGAGQPNVNGQTLGRMIIPLPPVAEQHCIVPTL